MTAADGRNIEIHFSNGDAADLLGVVDERQPGRPENHPGQHVDNDQRLTGKERQGC